MIAGSPVGMIYDTLVGGVSAYEMLASNVAGRTAGGGAAPAQPPGDGGGIGGLLGSVFGTDRPRGQRLTTQQPLLECPVLSVVTKQTFERQQTGQ